MTLDDEVEDGERTMTRSRVAAGVLALPGGLALMTALVDGGLRLLRGSTATGGDPAAAITGLAALVAALIAAWLTLCLALALAAELPGTLGRAARRLGDRITPLVVRRWAAIVLGASVSAPVMPGTAVAVVRSSDAPPAGTASGASPTSPGWQPSSTPTPTALPAPGFSPSSSTGFGPSSSTGSAPGWVPSRPPARSNDDPRLLTGRPRPTTTDPTVVVRRGDTLWAIAAAHLGPEATDAEITRVWRRWHETNAAAIGPDPHALRPGTVLSPPTP